MANYSFPRINPFWSGVASTVYITGDRPCQGSQFYLKLYVSIVSWDKNMLFIRNILSIYIKIQNWAANQKFESNLFRFTKHFINQKYFFACQVHSQHQQTQPFKTNPNKHSRFRGEVFFLNLEDGYFGCQVNESTDYLQLYDLSRICDGNQDCFLGSDELSKELKCTSKYQQTPPHHDLMEWVYWKINWFSSTDDCDKDGTQCTNGVCLNGVCHCNDGFGGCNCVDPGKFNCTPRTMWACLILHNRKPTLLHRWERMQAASMRCVCPLHKHIGQLHVYLLSGLSRRWFPLWR